MNRLLLSIAVLVFVTGCSPSEESIQKAVAKGDYQYIENYIANPKYWDNPKQTSTNAAAVEALVVLNRINTAANLYKENKGKPKEEMIVKAFVNALAKSTPQKMPEKVVELIDDGRNNSSDVLLRETAVKIEQSLSVGKIKAYVERAVENRKNANIDSSIDFVNKAISWDIKSTLIPDVAKTLISQYSELKSLYDHINLKSKKEEAQAIENEIDRIWREGGPLLSEGAVADAVYGQGAYSHMSDAERMNIINKNFSEERKREAAADKKKQSLEDIRSEIQAIEKSIPEYEAKINAKTPEVEAAEAQFMEKLNATSK